MSVWLVSRVVLSPIEKIHKKYSSYIPSKFSIVFRPQISIQIYFSTFISLGIYISLVPFTSQIAFNFQIPDPSHLYSWFPKIPYSFQIQWPLKFNKKPYLTHIPISQSILFVFLLVSARFHTSSIWNHLQFFSSF